MKILLTGANGQLASDLSPRLAKEGFSVRGLDSKSLDITDKAKVLEEVNRTKPDIIINCGAYTQVDLAEEEREKAFKVNKDGPANLAEAAGDVAAALVHISTDFVFDGLRSTPYGETEKTNPLGVYGQSKLEGEGEVARRLKEHIIVRASWVYGVYGKGGHNFVKTILKYAAERDFLNVVYDQVGTPTWTADLADALVKIVNSLEEGRTDYGIYHYSNEGVASWYDFADSILEEARLSGASFRCAAIKPILTSEYPTLARRPAYSVLDKSKIKNTFAITIPHWRASLRNMLKELNIFKKGGGLA